MDLLLYVGLSLVPFLISAYKQLRQSPTAIADISAALRQSLTLDNVLLVVGFWCAVYLIFVAATVYKERCDLVTALSEKSAEIARLTAIVARETRLVNPVIKVQYLGAAIGEARDRPQDTTVTLVLRVTNTGSPTVLTDWTLAIFLSGEQMMRMAERMVLQSADGSATQIVLNRAGGGGPWIISRDDDLAAKTAETPIPTGGAKEGYLLYLVRGIIKDKLNQDHRFLLLCRDVNGTEYQFPQPPQAGLLGPDHIPNAPGLKRQ